MTARLWTAFLLGCAACKAPTMPASDPASPRVSDRNEGAVQPDGPRPLTIADEDPDAPRTPSSGLQVQLPPSPNFDDADVAKRYDDGAFSIRGLRDDVDGNVADGDAGKEVVVRAWVQEVYVPPKCPSGAACPPPKQPHIWVTDREGERGKKRAMLVVNYRFAIPEWDAKRWKGQPTVELEAGKRYTFKGKFRRFSDTGFAFAGGLLEFVAYKKKTRWVAPPGAPWHPIEIRRMEREDAALADKAAKSGR